MSLRDWFIAPPPEADWPQPVPNSHAWRDAGAHDDPRVPHHNHAYEPTRRTRRPVPVREDVEPAARRTPRALPVPDDVEPPPGRSRGAVPAPDAPTHRARRSRAPARDAADQWDRRPREAPRRDSPTRDSPYVAAAAVIGRRGEAEPVAAAIALTLKRLTHARAAAVVVVGDGEPEVGGGGAPGARRLATRLAAHGFEAAERGRLVWVAASAPTAAGAALVGAPAVLAITAPLTPELEDAIAEQDIAVVVTPDEEGPLAALAIASLARPGLVVLAVRPLPRGPARVLARAGIAAPRAVRDLVERAL